ncbi:MAG: hypothetical protein CVV64_22345 [Candidatus Wallbacteria bacterium HGW-Wallbacteria-1]|uniref:Uncharacterized protein n=1 Tax=Candidatus Wallbacteria bacterium HGW-Wallbacteria-1 TaxID=2013854 RepID=A0A2N1PG30_9BACT|nr:MAG: hypothetical protein CVV64_22345 [Candidatus Wallbacteria bacterium HGW-Wallbacteria-1]
MGIIQHRKVFCCYAIFYGDLDNFSTFFRILLRTELKRRKPSRGYVISVEAVNPPDDDNSSGGF